MFDLYLESDTVGAVRKGDGGREGGRNRRTRQSQSIRTGFESWFGF